MENLHEMGWREQQRRVRIAKTVVAVVAGVIVAGFLFVAGARFDRIAMNDAMSADSVRTEWYGIKSVTAVLPQNGGGWMVRVVAVPEETKAEARGEKLEARVAERKGK